MLFIFFTFVSNLSIMDEDDLKYQYFLSQMIKNKDAILNGKYNIKNLTRIKKERSLGDLKIMQEYYLKRYEKAFNNLQKFIHEKVFKNKNIKKENGHKSIYYPWKDTHYKVTFSYNDRYKCYSISENSLSNMGRNDVLDFLTLHNDNFTLSEEFLILQNRTRTPLLSICNRKFENKLDEVLNNHFKDIEIPKSFIIKINDIKYTVKCCDLYAYNKRFDILSELDLKNIINL